MTTGLLPAPIGLKLMKSDPLEHSVPVRIDPWVRRLGSLVPVDLVIEGRISRRSVFVAAHAAEESTEATARLFVASMMFGFGPVGYGPYRTQQMLNDPAALKRLATVRAVARTEGPGQGYGCLADRGVGRVVGLGPAFGTKFLYFAGYQRGVSQSQPLILDALVAKWLAPVLDRPLRPWVWDSGSYDRYLTLVHAWRDELKWEESDQVERAIFRAARDGVSPV